MNYTVKMNCTDFFTDLMDSYGFCSQSLQVWSTQGWHAWLSLKRDTEKEREIWVMFNLTGLNYFRHFPSNLP